MKNGISTDEYENPNAHGEGPEHLHPLRVTMLFQESCHNAPSLLRGWICVQNTQRVSGVFSLKTTEQVSM